VKESLGTAEVNKGMWEAKKEEKQKSKNSNREKIKGGG